MSSIELKGINKYYDKVHVLKDLDLTIEDGDFMTLLGPSGCGKTTTLRVVSGLEKPQTGVILIDNNEIVKAEEMHFEPPSKRGLNLVFQSYALWPHMTVFENVAFGLNVKKVPKQQVKDMVASALKRMHIEEYAQRYPSELSGGQQQRVAIARAIVSNPHILLLDEPLSNLDAKLRVEMRSELKRLHRELNTTIIYVTHDQVEALTMSTKIAVFFEGRLVQVAPPVEVYNNPIDLRVADFIGNPRINFVPTKCKIVDNSLVVESPIGNYTFNPDSFAEDIKGLEGEFEGVMAIRPEHISVSEENKLDLGWKIYSSMPAGSETLIQVAREDVNILGKIIGQKEYPFDAKVDIIVDGRNINVYRKDTGRLIKRAE